MKKFMLRRIGVADDWSSTRPSLHDCMEIVLSQGDSLIGCVLDGLSASATDTTEKVAFGNHSPVSKIVANLLLNSQASAIKRTFQAELRLGIYNSGSQDFVEPSPMRFEDLQLLDSQQIDASIELAMAQQEVTRCIEDVLPLLSALISNLLGWITAQPQLNPLKPEVFVRALQACLVKHAPDEQARASLIVPSAGLLGVNLRQLYLEICDWLQSQGVEPASPVSASMGGFAAMGPVSENSVSRTLVTLDKLRRLLAGEFDSSAGRSGPYDFSHTVPASFMALEDLKLVEPMMKRLAERAKFTTVVTAKPEIADQHRVSGQGNPWGGNWGMKLCI